METADHNNIPGLLLLIDFEKAYDSISWNYMDNVLKYFGFGSSILKWIRLFNNNIKATVTQCGFFSEYFDIKRGCRQGDPISSYIFLLCAEILTLLLKANKDIKGLSIKDVQYLITQFADDTSLLLDGSEKSLSETMKMLNYFARLSGLKLNETKTKAIWIGSK